MFSLVHTGNGTSFYATLDSAGFDICANETVTILPGTWKLIATGLKITENTNLESNKLFSSSVGRLIPELQLRPRSGLAAKFGVTILNAPSTIDADYRGEIKVNLINHGTFPFEVMAGDRIAQAVCALVIQLPGIEVQNTERGEGGFGSTGV